MSRNTDLLLSKAQDYLIRNFHSLETFFIEINTTCNLHCKHCYIPISEKQNILPLSDITKILDQIYKRWGNSVGIAITGGEPLVHPDFSKIAELLGKYKFNWSLATNGISLDTEMIQFIQDNGCNAVTISLDGDEQSHNIQRESATAFKKTIATVDNLIKNNFPNIQITSTIHKDNVKSLKYIYSLISKYRNQLRWRINPLLFCESVQRNNLMIDTKIYNTITDFIKKTNSNLGVVVKLGEKNPLAIKYEEYLYSEFDCCSAGISTFGILANGDIVNCMVCRDSRLGNIKEDIPIEDIWNAQSLERKGLCGRHLEAKDSLFVSK